MGYRVCYITTLPSTIESFILKHALYGIEHGDWDVTVICSDAPGFRERLPQAIRYIPVDMKRGISFSGFKSTAELFKILKTEQFDLVQYATANAGAYASLAAKWAKVPIRLYTQWGIGYVYMKGIRRFLKGSLERMICANSTHVQPDSKENLHIAFSEKLYDEKKGCVIGSGSACGIDLKKYDFSQKEKWRKETREKYSIPDESFVLGYVGRLLKDKGIDELLDAFKAFHDRYPDTLLMIVGNASVSEGVDQDKLKWARQEKSVIFTGPTNEVEKYYASMDCFTLPSYHEGFGMVTIEAEAMGVPIVDTDIPGSREAMQDGVTGILVPKKNAEALLKGIVKMYESEEMRERFSRNGVEYVRRCFDDRILCELTFQNRESLLSEAGRG